MRNQSLVYNKKLLDHYQNPRNFGKLKKPTHQSHRPNPACGDEVTVYLKISGGKLADFKWEGRGCAVMTASASVLSELLMGKNVTAVDKVRRGDIEKLLAAKIPRSRDECLLLPLQAINKALFRA